MWQDDGVDKDCVTFAVENIHLSALPRIYSLKTVGVVYCSLLSLTMLFLHP